MRGGGPRPLVGVVAVVVTSVCNAGCAESSPDTAQVSPPITTAAADIDVPMGTASELDGYRLTADEVTGQGGQAIKIGLTVDGSPIDSVDGDRLYVFVIGDRLSYVDREVVPAQFVSEWLAGWHNVGGVGTTRIVVRFERDGQVHVLGTDVEVREPSDFEEGLPDIATGNAITASGVTVRRDAWDFIIDTPWGGDPTGDPAWLTLVRRSDLAVLFSVGELVGDRTFRFDPPVPEGEYLAILSFVPYAAFGVGPDSGITLEAGGGADFGFDISVPGT